MSKENENLNNTDTQPETGADTQPEKVSDTQPETKAVTKSNTGGKAKKYLLLFLVLGGVGAYGGVKYHDMQVQEAQRVLLEQQIEEAQKEKEQQATENQEEQMSEVMKYTDDKGKFDLEAVGVKDEKIKERIQGLLDGEIINGATDTPKHPKEDYAFDDEGYKVGNLEDLKEGKHVVLATRVTCPNCSALRQNLDLLVKQLGTPIEKFETDDMTNEEKAELMEEYEVSYVPDLFVVEDGKVIYRTPTTLSSTTYSGLAKELAVVYSK